MTPGEYLSRTKAHLVARYRLHSLPGRPEELEFTVPTHAAGADQPTRVVSLAYSGGELRVRKHGGPGNRTWVDHRDFRLQDDWLPKVNEYLDEFFGVGDQPGQRRVDHPVAKEVLSFGRPERPKPTLLARPRNLTDPLLGHGDSAHFEY